MSTKIASEGKTFFHFSFDKRFLGRGERGRKKIGERLKKNE